jgi:imidazolonepropionase-like amidohydrolase
MTSLTLRLALAVGFLALPTGSRAQEPPEKWTVFKSVKVFDGKSNAVKGPMHVAVVGNKIQTVSDQEIPIPKGVEAEVIDCRGKPWVLMPGLIDAHVHATVGMDPNALLTADNTYVALRGAAELGMMLDRGFTSVRDMGGNTFGLKRAIDEGRLRGPRIFPSGAIISQTSGHGDYRLPSDKPRRFGGPFGRAEQLGVALVADGRDEVLVATREQLRLGATQIKLAVGGGVVSSFDPVDVNEYSEEEIRAAVSAATNWGTYVAVHVYTAEGCVRAMKAGVRCLEHATKIDEATMKQIAALPQDKSVFISLQVLAFRLPFTTDKKMQKRNDDVARGIPNVVEWSQKHKTKVCFGTDLLLDPRPMAAQSAELTARVREGFTPIEVLRQATGVNGELIALSGKRNSYDEDGPLKIGVVEPGAVADLLLVDGDPTKNLSLLVDWDPIADKAHALQFATTWDPTKSVRPPGVKFGSHLLVIMKDGAFHKNSFAKEKDLPRP